MGKQQIRNISALDELFQENQQPEKSYSDINSEQPTWPSFPQYQPLNIELEIVKAKKHMALFGISFFVTISIFLSIILVSALK